MFKTPVVLSAVLFASLYSITACSALVPQPQFGFPESLEHAIARELVVASADHLLNTSKPLYVKGTSDQNRLRNALIDELAANQHLLANDAVNAHQLTVAAAELGDDALHIAFAIDGLQIIERVFRFETGVAPIATSALADSRGESRTIVAKAAKRSDGDDARTSQSVSVLDEETTPSVVWAAASETALVEESSDSPECTHTELQQGSLKQSLIHILHSCGWRLASWPADPDESDHELDWLVPNARILEIETFAELIQALRTSFDFEIELDDTAKTVRIQLRD